MRPSLLIIPANETPGVLMPQIPFNGTADFTVSRTTTPANNSTRVNSSGLIEIVNDNVPRIDYLNQSCPGLLVEPSAQNLLLRSEEFTVSGTWTSVTGGTGVAPIVTQATGIVDPAGGNTADLIQLNVGSGTLSTDFSILRQSITVTAVAHTFSVYLRSATSGNQFVAIRFDSAPQTILTITPSWQRFTFTGTPTAGSRDFGFDLRGNNTSASGSTQFYAWGAQFEAGSNATSYIPTTTTTGSRTADVISASGVSGLIGQTEGTIYIEYNMRALNVEGYAIRLVAANFDNSVHIRRSTGNLVTLELRSANSNVFSQTFPATGFVKAAIAYKSGDIAAFVNGTQTGSTITSAFTFGASFTSVNLGTFGTAAFLNDHIRAAALYTTRLPNDDLIRLTLPSTYVTYNDMALGLAYTIK